MLPECHLLVLQGRRPLGSHCVQVLFNRRSPFDKSLNLFTICCLQILLVVMLISPNSRGCSGDGTSHRWSGISSGENEVLECTRQILGNSLCSNSTIETGSTGGFARQE